MLTAAEPELRSKVWSILLWKCGSGQDWNLGWNENKQQMK
jgi:hypothetical protein